MNIEKELLEDRQAKLIVDYSEEEFEGFKRRAAKKIAKNVKIPGFRPGKAPYNVIVNHYGENVIVEEAIDVLLDSDYSKILEQAEIEPAEQGSLESIESYDPPKLVFMIPLEPEIDLGDYREIRKPYELEEFDVKQVDDFIMNMRQNAATIIPAEHPAKEGDLVYFNLSGKFLDTEDDEEATITDKTPQQVVIPEKGEKPDQEWPYPGFARELIGVEDGQTKEIKHTFSKKHENKDYRGRDAHLTVEIQSVKELELPELDEDFIKSMGNYETVEDFKVSIEENLRSEHQNTYDQEYFDDLMNEIIENAKLNYPPQMLAHEEKHVLDDIKSRLENQKLDFETYLKLRDTDEETFMEEEIRPTAKKRIERSLVTDELIKAEDLKLDEDMFKEQLNSVMTEVYYSGNAQEMQKQMGKEEFSRAISMEGFQRTINTQLETRLKLIATGQPIPEETEEKEDEETEKTAEEKPVEEEIAKDETAVENTAEEPVEVEATEISEEVDEELQTSDQETVEETSEPEAEEPQEEESK